MQENKKEFLITGGGNQFIKITEEDDGFYLEDETEEWRAWFEDDQLYNLLDAVCKPVCFNWSEGHINGEQDEKKRIRQQIKAGLSPKEVIDLIK